MNCEKEEKIHPIFEFTLPLPVSVNDLHSPRRGGGIMLSQAGRAYYSVMRALLPTIWKHEPWGVERLRLEYTLHENDLRRRDVSNYVKSLQDALEGFVYVNDSQLDEVLCLRGELRCQPCVIVKVTVIDEPLVRVALKKEKKKRDLADAVFESHNAKKKALKVAGVRGLDTLKLSTLKASKASKSK